MARLSRVLQIHHRQRWKPSPVRQLIGHEVQTPDLVRPGRLDPFPSLTRPLCASSAPSRRSVSPSSRYNRITSDLPTDQPSRCSSTSILRHPVAHPHRGDLPHPHPQLRARIFLALISVCPRFNRITTQPRRFTHSVASTQLLDHLTASRRLQNFFASTSCSMVLSSVSSATSRFSRWFSSCN